MAETTNIKPETAKAKPAELLVEVFIPKGYANEDPNLFVSVNGVNYLLPRGKKSMVPTHIKAEIDRATEAENILDRHIDEMLEAAK